MKPTVGHKKGTGTAKILFIKLIFSFFEFFYFLFTPLVLLWHLPVPVFVFFLGPVF